MDEVKIAYYDETFWLVVGEKYIDIILAGHEELECEVVFVTCETWPEVKELWEIPDGQMPWAIHPKIIARLKRQIVARKRQQIVYDVDDDAWNLNKN